MSLRFRQYRQPIILFLCFSLLFQPELLAQACGAWRTTEYEYDAAGRQTAVIDPNGDVTEYEYTGSRRVLARDSLGRETRFIYDNLGRLTRTIYPDGSDSHTSYDELGRRTARTDQADRTRWFEYDKAGSLTAAILTAVNDPCNDNIATYPRTEYKHDIYGNLAEIWTNVKESPDTGQLDETAKRVTKFAYDHLHNQVSRALPNGKTEYKEYNELGQVVKITDFNDHVTTFTYNDSNNPGLLEEQRHYVNDSYYTGNPDDPNLEIHISYDELGRKTVVDVNDEGVESAYGYHYDAEGRVYQIDSPQGFVRYEFSDITGQKTAVRTPAVDADTQISYTYDGLGRLASVQVNKRNNVTPSNEITAYAYNTVGSLAKITYPNGNTAAYTYDNLNRLTNLVHKNSSQTTLASYAYTLAADGKRTSVTELNGTVINWEYDALNRLVTEDYNVPGDANDFEHTYVYDLVGNRLKKQVDGEPDTIYSYNNNDQLIQETTDANSIYYSYNYNGSLIEEANDTEAIRTYAYNLQNRLASLDNGTNVVDYTYNPDGIRVKAAVAGGSTTEYLIDSDNPTGYAQVFKEKQGATETAYIIGHDVIAQAVGTDAPVYLLYDGHGSVRQLADNTGALITGQQFNFDAYGNLVNTVTPQTNLLYTGEMWDSHISGYNLRARDYRPNIGRFMTQDTYSGNTYDPISLHKYLYCHANPVNAIDPSGRESLLSVTLAITIASFILMAPTWVNAPGHHDTPIPDQGGQMILDMGIALGITTGAMVVARFVVPQIRAAASPWVRGLFNKIRFRNTMRVSSIESPLANSRRLLTGSTQLELNKAGGDAFEETVRASLRTTKGSSVVTSHGTVIPDMPVGNIYGVTDAKNVIKICRSPQTRGFAEAARAQNVPFNLIISPRTQTVSEPLKKAIESTGGTIFEFDSASGIFKTVYFSGNKVIR